MLTLSNLVKTVLYLDLFEDAFAEEAYDASLAGLGYSTWATSDMLYLNISGYNDKSLILLELILKRMKDFVIKPERFKVIKDNLMRGYDNMKLRRPSSLAASYNCQLFSEKYYSAEEKLTMLEGIDMEQVQTFFPELFQQFFIESFVFGNMEKEDVKEMVKIVQDLFKPKVLEKSRMVKSRNVRLPKGKKYVYQNHVFDKDELNGAILYQLQCGDNKDRFVMTRLKIISQILKEPIFDHLRTKEQLGEITIV